MLLWAVLLVAADEAVSITVSALTGPLQSGGKATLQWTSNANTDPSTFVLELYSPTFNSVDIIAKNVDTFSNQITAQLPTLPPSGDYIFWFVDPTNSSNVYANSYSFPVVAADQSKSSTPSNVPPPTTSSAGPPVVTPTPEHSLTTPKDTLTSPSAASQIHSASQSKSPSTIPPTASSASSTSFTKIIKSPPTSSTSSSSGHPNPQPLQTQSAIHVSQNSLTSGSIAGIAVGALCMLTLGVLVWFCMRRIRKKPRLSLRPEGYILSPSEDERGVGGVPHGQPPVAPQLRGEKSRSPDSDLNPHESLAEQLHAMRSQLAELSGVGTDVEHALQQNEALRARIRALENELQSQTGSERSGQSPPGYTAIPGVIGF